MITIIDNFLTPGYSDTIEHDAFNYLCYEYKRKTSINYKGMHDFLIMEDENTYDEGQMVCPIWSQTTDPEPPFGKYEQFIRPLTLTIIDKCKEMGLDIVPVKIKFNLLRRTEFPETHYNIPHVDMDVPGRMTAVYYVSNSDGDTYLFNEFYNPEKLPEKLTVAQRVQPKKNRLVIFEADRFHASSNPRINADRSVINFVFKQSCE